MLSNSSMQHRPPSASTSAPASKLQAPPSFMAEQVRPAPAAYMHIHERADVLAVVTVCGWASSISNAASLLMRQTTATQHQCVSQAEVQSMLACRPSCQTHWLGHTKKCFPDLELHWCD
jgi:hypothetical protein